MTLTPEQQAAVDARGGSLTLSAAAGSGKTRVLTERAVARMLDTEHPIDADRLLIVTFTRAAAAEMKSRIVNRLTTHLRENPHDEHARRQRTLLARARIGTIDSLCSAILRENFQQVGIPANFRIGDESEIAAMREQAMSDVLEKAYRTGSQAFLDLAELFSNGSSDRALTDAISRVLDFARARPYYRRWIDEKLSIYRDFTYPRDSIWAKVLFEYAHSLVSLEIRHVQSALDMIAQDDTLAPYTAMLQYDLATLQGLDTRIAGSDWDGCVSLLAEYNPPRLSQAKKADVQKREYIKSIRNHAKDLLKKQLPTDAFPADEKDFAADAADLLPKVDCLFGLVKDTDTALQSEKIDAGILDFADIEQLTCTLLTNEDGSLTATAHECAARYDEVMVDESQDINEVQNRILTALSSRSGLFCVGDVKQSIYRFRMACPQLFLDRVAAGHIYDGKHFPATLYLNGNFRTVPEVTSIVNSTFSALMSREAGEVDYDETQRLVALGQFPAGGERGVDLCIIRKENNLGEADEDLYAEPVWVAGEIARLLQTAQINDNDTMRPVRASDIAILLRSPRSSAQRYRRALRTAGIDAKVNTDAGFLSAPEVECVLNALTAIANPLRDVEMLGMLSSPIGGFTDDELAEMRTETKSGPLYAALTAYGEHNEHAARFLSTFTQLRQLSAVLPPEELIGELLCQSGYDLLCRRMKRGAERSANLILLQHYAAQETGDAVPSLEGFLRRIERVRQSGRDLPAAVTVQDTDAVSILSIHHSKGLEWPIVFVCDLGREHGFFRQELMQPTILNSDCGFACVRRDRRTRRQFVSVPLAAVRAQKQRDLLSEELRVLYVAMTRAKERLYLTGAVGDVDKALARAAASAAEGEGVISPAEVRSGKTFFDWVLPALATVADLGALAASGERVGGLRLHTEYDNEVYRAENTAGRDAAAAQPDEAAAQRLAAAIQRHYEYADAAAMPAKISVSALTHGDEGLYFRSVPQFMSDGKIDGAARGTAMHRFMQACDIAAAGTDIYAEIDRLREAGILTDVQAESLGTRQLRKFFEGPLAQRMLAADRVLREFRMMAPAARGTLSQDYVLPSGEAAMLQGVADCVLIEGSHAVLLDYKTDYVISGDILLDRYSSQLLLYRDMLTRQLGMPVTEGYIYSFALRQTITVFDDGAEK